MTTYELTSGTDIDRRVELAAAEVKALRDETWDRGDGTGAATETYRRLRLAEQHLRQAVRLRGA